MKKLNLLLTFLIGMSCLLFVNSTTVSAQSVHDELNDVRKNGNHKTDKIMDEFKVSEVKKDGSLKEFKSRETVMNDTKIQVKWGFNTDNKYEKNDVLTYKIPEGISLERDYSGDLRDTSDTSTEAKEPTRETNASFFMSKESRTISIIFNKKTPAVNQDYNVTFETRLYYPDPDAAMLKELEWNTKNGDKIFYLNVPFSGTIKKSEEDSLILVDNTGQETDYMPKKAKMKKKVNNYQVVSTYQGQYDYGFGFDRTMVTGNKTIGVEINKSSIKLEAQSITASGKPIGEKETLKEGIDYKFEKDDRVIFLHDFNKVIYVTYEADFDYSKFEAADYNRDRFTTGFRSNAIGNDKNLPEEIQTFTDRYENYYWWIDFNLKKADQRKFLKFEEEYQKLSDPRSNLTFRKSDEPIHEFKLFVNLNKDLLRKNTKILIELDNQPKDVNEEQVFMNEVKGAPIYSYDVAVTEEGEVTLNDYNKRKESKDWKIEGDSSGHKLYLTYVGEDTDQSIGLSVPVGRSSRFGRWNFDQPGKASVVDSKGKTWIDKFRLDNVPDGENGVALWSNLFAVGLDQISISSTVNKIYMPLDKVEYTFREKAELKDVRSISIKNTGYGKKENEAETLEQGKDFKVNIDKNVVTITFLTEVKGRISIGYNLEYKMEKEDISISYTIAMIPKDGSPKRQLWSGGGVPGVWLSDSAVFFSKHNAVYKGADDEKIMFDGNKPINEGMYVINPRAREYTLKNYKIGDASNTKLKFGNQLKIYRLNRPLKNGETFNSVINEDTSTEILPTDKDYPKIETPSNSTGYEIMFTFNQEIKTPIAIRFGAEKENYYDQTTASVSDATEYEGNYHTDSTKGRIDFTTKLKAHFIAEKSTKYTEMINVSLKVPAMENAFIKKDTNFVINANLNNADIYNAKIILKDADGNIIPSSDVDVMGDVSIINNHRIIIKVNKDLHKGLDMVIPVVYRTSGDKIFTADKIYEELTRDEKPSEAYREPAKLTGQNTVNIDVSEATGTGSITIRKVVIKVIDSVTKKPISGAGFEISDGTDKMTTKLSGENGLIDAGGLLLREYNLENTVTPDYYLKGKDQKFTVKKQDVNEVLVELDPYSIVNVHFTYPDKTILDEVNPKIIELKQAPNKVVDLTKIDLVKNELNHLKENYPMYRYISFDKGIGEGDETKYKVASGKQDVYFYYQGVMSIDATKEMVFEDGINRKKKQTLKYLDDNPFELVVQDFRQSKSASLEPSMLRGNFKINASLTKPFRLNDDPNKELTDAELFYNNGDKRLPLNGKGSEILSMKQSAEDPAKKEFKFILDKKDDNKSFEVDVTPDRVSKNQYYQGEVSFELVQGP
ncbi:prealbumin-like fold domain-containing protein [Vagococcus hydrophili]|uniref:SpaA-like prealbumin fold domain-containing protein n=1 Tax=Vagococcus hydrophili TaxID=2714947 RepID=A0A6G8ATU5_9ENTE|nr:prealbumin-like fold domain-containing protein [Vagococcus hydrophili]QIL48400.1 hypothetical protein G7082_07785 [Vagococcus hydrophili]